MKRATLLALALTASCSRGPAVKAVEETPAQQPDHRARKPKPSATVSSNENDPPPPPGQYLELDWQTLRGLDVRTGQTTPLVELAVGANVRIAGYLVPFDDGTEETSEFLVVPSAGMCVHTPPPPPNQMVLAQASGRPVKMINGAVWVYGKLDLDAGSSPYGQTAYRMNAEAVRAAR